MFNQIISSTVLCISAFCIIGTFARNCAPRNYGHGSVVCVCNATYCDDLIGTVTKTEPGVVVSFVTSIAGDRFAKSELRFAATTQFTNANQSTEKVSIEIDRTQKYQKIIGFGGAFTDAAGINIATLPAKLQTRLLRDYFGDDGIAYSLGRIPIGGCDFSTRPYTYDDNENDESLQKFALQEEDLKYKIPFIHLAQQISANNLRFYASSWSAPAWMKTNKKLNNGGFLIGAPGEKYYKLYAKYLIKFLDEYEKQNISMWAMTIQNEPEAGFLPDFKWNSMGFNHTLERDFLKFDLGPELHRNGYTQDKLKVMIHDGQVPMAKDAAITVFSDKEAAKFASGLAIHWYWNPFANFSELDYIHQMFPDYFILATEACEEHSEMSEHVLLGNWTVFNRYADDIIKDLNHYVTGWTDWNLALDLKGGPNWAKNNVDAPIIVNATSGEYYKQPIFYALGHFSKLLVRDSVRVRHHLSNHNQEEDDNILVTVFERPDNGTVLTVLNKHQHPIMLHVHDPVHGNLDVAVKAEALQSLIWF